MKLIWNYATDVLTLPAALVDHLEKATKKDIRILLALAADPAARIDLEAAISALCARASLSEGEVDAALSFWRGAGILLLDREEAAQQPAAEPVAEPPRPTVRVIADKGLPSYSYEELSEVLERRGEMATLINECQNAFGKIFNNREVAVIAGMVDYLGLEGEYILLLLEHCMRMEKKSMRYVEKMAISLHDEGILGAQELEERLHRIEVMASAGGKIRAMFGISSRALTTKEQGIIEKWICTMQFPDEVLQKAYEITVDTTGKAAIPYANSILERWYAEGYRTLEDVEAAIADYRRKKNEGKGSFDVDDFFEAALKRTYGK